MNNYLDFPGEVVEDLSVPFIATAIHDGHGLRKELAGLCVLSDADMLREEDPFTGDLSTVAPTRILVHASRFEVDLNRPRKMAVYLRPEDAWGLSVWKSEPSQEMILRSLVVYDNFYRSMEILLTRFIEKFGSVVVYDLHSYNHRRLGPDGPAADPAGNPDVNIGTGMLDRARWGRLVDQFKNDLRECAICDRTIDVRENVKFQGGYFSRWCHTTFSSDVCVLAIEWKKIFMDEWTGNANPDALASMRKALQATVPGMLKAREQAGK
ncbi:MAG: N-formylglutamate amidohydrolase [Patescibacteria group bacterium]